MPNENEAENEVRRPWIRIYTEVPDDPKVQLLTAEIFRFWINCLCLCGNYDGVLPSFNDLAWKFKITPHRAEKSVKILVDAGLFEQTIDGKFIPHSWSSRQRDSDLSTDRVRGMRKRLMKRDETVSSAVSSIVSSEPRIVNNIYTTEEILKDKWFNEEFWPNFWRKVDKAEAKRSFKKHATDEAKKDRIVAAVKTQYPYYIEREERHRPHASTWLNKFRYDDQIEETPAKKVAKRPDWIDTLETPEQRNARLSGKC